MIGSLRGRLLETGADEILVEVDGIGYRILVTPSSVVTVGDVGDEVFVYIHQHVRDDAHLLYGFAARDERVCFEALIGAHGVHVLAALGWQFGAPVPANALLAASGAAFAAVIIGQAANGLACRSDLKWAGASGETRTRSSTPPITSTPIRRSSRREWIR